LKGRFKKKAYWHVDQSHIWRKEVTSCAFLWRACRICSTWNSWFSHFIHCATTNWRFCHGRERGCGS